MTSKVFSNLNDPMISTLPSHRGFSSELSSGPRDREWWQGNGEWRHCAQVKVWGCPSGWIYLQPVFPLNAASLQAAWTPHAACIAVFSSATPWCPLRCAGWGWLQVTGNAAGKQPLVRELTPAFIYFSGVNTALRMRGSFADVPSEFEIVFFLKGMYLEEIAAPKHQVMLSYYRLLFVCLFLLPTIMAKLPSCKQWAVWIALLFIIVRPRCVFFFRSYLHKKAQ